MKQKIIELLQNWSQSSHSTQYIVYVYGNPVIFAGVKAFNSEGIAKRAILNRVFGRNRVSSDSKEAQALNELIESKIIEIKQV